MDNKKCKEFLRLVFCTIELLFLFIYSVEAFWYSQHGVFFFIFQPALPMSTIARMRLASPRNWSVTERWTVASGGTKMRQNVTWVLALSRSDSISFALQHLTKCYPIPGFEPFPARPLVESFRTIPFASPLILLFLDFSTICFTDILFLINCKLQKLNCTR